MLRALRHGIDGKKAREAGPYTLWSRKGGDEQELQDVDSRPRSCSAQYIMTEARVQDGDSGFCLDSRER